MKKLFLSVLAVFCCMGISAQSNAEAKELMRLGFSTPAEHVYGVFAEKFKELAEEYTNGAVEVKLFPNAQLGSEDAAFKSLQIGTVDAYIVTMSTLSPHYPLMDAFSLPYCFESLEKGQKVLRSKMARDFFDEFEKVTKVAILTYGSIDLRDLYNTKKPINTFEDFAGLKYRVPKNEVMIETFKAFGAEPVPLAWSETPSALQTGTVDGGDNGTTVILQMKFYEIAKHLTVLDHFFAFSPLLVSPRFLGKVDAETRAQLERAAKEANEYSDAHNIAEIEKTRAFLQNEGGMKVTYPDREKFIAAGIKVQDQFASTKGPEFQELLLQIRELQK